MAKTRTLKELKKAFLDFEKVDPNASGYRDLIFRKSLYASVRVRGSKINIYAPNTPQKKRKPLRDCWKKLLCEISEEYETSVNGCSHCSNISRISDTLSGKYASLLVNDRLRIGIAQKSLNLYLKYLWCSEKIKVPPPHCTVDRVILAEVYKDHKVPEWEDDLPNWTECDDIDEYKKWIREIDKVEKKPCLDSLAAWELAVWNSVMNGG